MKPDNIYKKDLSIYDLAKTDIPIPVEYQNMGTDELLEGITANIIPIVYIFYKYARIEPGFENEDFNFTLYWPGKEPEYHSYNKKWSDFIWNMNHIKADAKKKGYSVKIVNSSQFISDLYKISKPETLAKKKTCLWCGEITDTKMYLDNGKFNKIKPFCSDSNCKDNYQKYKYLLRTLVKDGKITKFEQDLRLNPNYSVIDDTANNGYLMLFDIDGSCNINSEEYDKLQEEEELPLISDNKFFLTPDEQNVVFADRNCLNCGRLFAGNKQAIFCSDKCRYDYHNKQKKELK